MAKKGIRHSMKHINVEYVESPIEPGRLIQADKHTGLHVMYSVTRQGEVVAYLYDIRGPKLSRVYGKRLMVVREDYIMVNPDGAVQTIEKGFVFDGASIPRALWHLFQPFDPRRVIPALHHDDSYDRAYIDRWEADEHLYCLLRAEGNSANLAWTYYTAVDIGGRYAWDKHRRENKERLKLTDSGLWVDTSGNEYQSTPANALK